MRPHPNAGPALWLAAGRTPRRGIADTVQDDTTGFLFDEFQPAALDRAISRGLASFADSSAWALRMRAAMQQDFGWERSAERYAQVYQQAIEMVKSRR